MVETVTEEKHANVFNDNVGYKTMLMMQILLFTYAEQCC